jgi:hypothetical protein
LYWIWGVCGAASIAMVRVRAKKSGCVCMCVCTQGVGEPEGGVDAC